MELPRQKHAKTPTHEIQGLYHADETDKFWTLLVKVTFSKERRKQK